MTEEWDSLNHEERMESALPSTAGGIYNLRLARLLREFLEWGYTPELYEWVLHEKQTTIAVQKEIEDYKGAKKWITSYSKVHLNDLCWCALWEQTYTVLNTASKFDRIAYCIANFPESLEDKKRLLKLDFLVEGPENETY